MSSHNSITAAQVGTAALGCPVERNSRASVFGPVEQFLNLPYLRQSAWLVSDVRLLGMSRTELVRDLVPEGYEVPVIITAYAVDEDAKARARANVASAYLIKLFDAEELFRALHRALKSDSQQRD